MTHQSHKSKAHKAQTDYRPTEYQIATAETIIRSLYDRWPEDDWFQLGPHADLNLHSVDGVKKALIHPVQGGSPVTSVWYRLYVQEAIGEYPP